MNLSQSVQLSLFTALDQKGGNREERVILLNLLTVWVCDTFMGLLFRLAWSGILVSTEKSHFKALSLYNFKRDFAWAYRRGGGRLISGWAYKRNKIKTFWITR